jgi:F-type H+-transporting ATPase subunit epsilon
MSHAADTGTRSLQCVVVTPERTVLDETVEFVALPMFDGELGVAPGRAPLIGRLGPGELRTRRAGTIRRFFVDGGFAQVRANVVTVLTPRAQRAEEIDTGAANQALHAGRTATTSADAQLKNQQRARAQLRVAGHGRGTTGGSHAAAH